ncbi:MAG TPA: hypothetical protein PLN85_00615 [archaeon]|jgi:hypothetical protein|nr:hypothetical protein [archaeon]
MKTNIQAVKIGNTINVSINGKLHKKNCSNLNDANDFYRVILDAKENPSEENLRKIYFFLNEKIRIAYLCGLETDPDNGEVFLAGFNTPIPNELVETIKEYHENGFPMDAIINFWKLLMINPDKRVRKSLFNFISTHDFVLTNKGYMVVYKAVYEKKKGNKLNEFVAEKYLMVRKDWKCNPNKYVVYQNMDGDFAITKRKTFEMWDEKEKSVVGFGKLGDLYEDVVLFGDSEENTTYTDMYTRSMNIELGKPVKMERTNCDSDPEIDCSYGLHVGATSYVQSFANSHSKVLVCLVNPAHVIAVPNYNHSKMRVSEYFPFAVAKYEDGIIDIIEDGYYEDDYSTYEIEELEKAVDMAIRSEIPYKAAIEAEEENRPMEELIKMLETRLVDIS